MSAQDNWLLDSRVGWRAALLDHTTTNGDTPGLQLVALPGQPRPLTDAQGGFGGFAIGTGIAVDADDNIYILDRQAQVVKRYDPCACAFETLSCIAGSGSAPRQVNQPSSLAISSRGDLYIADRGNRRIQIFALKGFPLRAIIGPLRVIRDAQGIHVTRSEVEYPPLDPTSTCAPELIPHSSGQAWSDGTWDPYDIALTNDCITYVSDCANGLIHVFDAGGRWRNAIDASLVNPTHIALDKKCNLYVVQEGKDFVVVIDQDGKVEGQVKQPDAVKGALCPVNVAVDDKGNVYIADQMTRCVNIFCPDDCDGFKHAGALRGSGYGGALAFDSSGNPLACDGEKQRIVCFAPPPSYPTEGRFISDALDSDIYRCQWHRVRLRAKLAPGTRVQVDTFTAEAVKSDAEIAGLPESRWATGQLDSAWGENEWDCLIASVPGRFLWLRLTLSGDGTATPLVEWVRVDYPRASSLQYLPAVYGEDAGGRAFLDHFLSITDRLTDRISQRIATMVRYFDPLATPATANPLGAIDFLTWLGSWLDLALDRHWSETRRRQLVKRAHELYRRRGTPEGLRLHLQLYLGLEPRVLEHFRVRRWLFLNHARLGDMTALWGADVVKRLQLDGDARIGNFQLTDSGDPLRDPFYTYAHIFTVFVPMPGEPNDAQKQTVARIVEMAKPAHALAKIEWVQPRFRIGIQSFVGVDTVVGEYPQGVTTGQGQLGYDTVLGPSNDESAPPTMRLGTLTRIGSSTLLD